MFFGQKYKGIYLNMHPEYETVSVSANIIQSTLNVLQALDKENIEIPNDPQEVTNDIQATVARLVGGTGVL